MNIKRLRTLAGIEESTVKHDEATCAHCHDASTLTPTEYAEKHKVLGDFHKIRSKAAKAAGSYAFDKIAALPDVHKHMSALHGDAWREKWTKARVHQSLVGESVEESCAYPLVEDGSIESLQMLEADAVDAEMVAAFAYTADLEEAARIPGGGSAEYHRAQGADARVKARAHPRVHAATFQPLSAVTHSHPGPERAGSNTSHAGRRERLHAIAAYHYHHAANAYAQQGNKKREGWFRAISDRHQARAGSYYIHRKNGAWRHTNDHGKPLPQESVVAKVSTVLEDYRRMSGLVDRTEDWTTEK